LQEDHVACISDQIQ
jgi:alkylation response protein AidB-like acyl-CoA dehydrogenase